MYIEPNTNLWLFEDMPFEPDYNHTVYFSSLAQQTSYFNSKISPARTFNKMSYQRYKMGAITVNATMSQIAKCNYMCFCNASFENKKFYAFITSVEYVSNTATRVFYSIDVLQTWMFDFELGECFIERTHSVTDWPGDNTLPENLPTGETMYYTKLNPEAVIGGSIGPFPADQYSIAIFYGTELSPVSGSYQPIRSNSFGGIDCLIYTDPSQAYAKLKEINDTQNNADAVVCVVQFPTGLLRWNNSNTVRSTFGGVSEVQVGVDDDPYASVNVYEGGVLVDKQVQRKFGNYIPVNNKLYTAPYFGLMGVSSDGSANTYSYEDFSTEGVVFYMNVAMSPKIIADLVPAYYKNLSRFYDESITLSDFPQCVYVTDAFKAWYAQNATSISLEEKASKAGIARNVGSSAFSIFNTLLGGGTPYTANSVSGQGNGTDAQLLDRQNRAYLSATGQAANTVLGAIGALGDTYNAIARASSIAEKTPDKIRGNAGSFINYARNTVGFYFYRYQIKEEYARIIDRYFHMYGYTTNKVEVPNLAVRPDWTYIKTAYVSYRKSSVPADDLSVITSIFNRGITFWKDPNKVGNYIGTNKYRNIQANG